MSKEINNLSFFISKERELVIIYPSKHTTTSSNISKLGLRVTLSVR